MRFKYIILEDNSPILFKDIHQHFEIASKFFNPLQHKKVRDVAISAGQVFFAQDDIIVKHGSVSLGIESNPEREQLDTEIFKRCL